MFKDFIRGLPYAAAIFGGMCLAVWGFVSYAEWVESVFEEDMRALLTVLPFALPIFILMSISIGIGKRK